MIRAIVNLWWRLVFWWKQRTGFVILHKNTNAVGRVLSVRSSSDGDRLINLELEPGFEWLCPAGLTEREHLHCEIPPWIRGPEVDAYATLQPGDRVMITGTWGYDGVHALPDSWPSWTFPLEVLLAIVRHQPTFPRGWFELHPVTRVEKLNVTNA